MNEELAVVTLACEKLDDDELLAISNVVRNDFNPCSITGYDKVSHLFTEDNGLRMHDDIKQILSIIVNDRLFSPVSSRE